MGVQRHDINPDFPKAKPIAKDKGNVQEKSGPLWNKLPQLLNLARYRMKPGQRDKLLDYEPIHLHISPSEVHPVVAAMAASSRAHSNTDSGILQVRPSSRPIFKEMAIENFKFLMEQVPTVRTIEFSGKSDPFLNADLIRMVNYAHQFNGAQSIIHTEGFMLNLFADEILKSNLHTLVVHLQADRPSAYSRLTSNPLTRFVTIRDNILRLVKRKRELNGKVNVELNLLVDVHNFRDIPDMIRFAEEMGVDSIRFENYMPSDPSIWSDRTLYNHQQPVVRFLETMRKTLLREVKLTSIMLPLLLDEDMSEHRYCPDPFSTVSVDSEFNVSGCSRQLLYRGRMSKIWDEDFWNNDMYQWLRHVHQPPNVGPLPTGSVTNAPKEQEAVPAPCLRCPKNLPCLGGKRI